MKCFVFPLPPPGMWNSARRSGARPEYHLNNLTPAASRRILSDIFYILSSSSPPPAVRCSGGGAVPGARR